MKPALLHSGKKVAQRGCTESWAGRHTQDLAQQKYLHHVSSRHFAQGRAPFRFSFTETGQQRKIPIGLFHS